MDKQDLLTIAPIDSPFKVGDVVTYTNSYGVAWHGELVIGFSEPDDHGRFIHLDSDSWWVLHSIDELKAEPEPRFSFVDSVQTNLNGVKSHLTERIEASGRAISKSDFVNYVGVEEFEKFITDTKAWFGYDFSSSNDAFPPVGPFIEPTEFFFGPHPTLYINNCIHTVIGDRSYFWQTGNAWNEHNFLC